jgi:hypothetical protein
LEIRCLEIVGSELYIGLALSLIINQYLLNPVKFYCIMNEKNWKFKNQFFNLIFYTHSISKFYCIIRVTRTSLKKRGSPLFQVRSFFHFLFCHWSSFYPLFLKSMNFRNYISKKLIVQNVKKGFLFLIKKVSFWLCMYVCMYVIRVAVAFATLELHICEWEGFL